MRSAYPDSGDPKRSQLTYKYITAATRQYMRRGGAAAIRQHIIFGLIINYNVEIFDVSWSINLIQVKLAYYLRIYLSRLDWHEHDSRVNDGASRMDAGVAVVFLAVSSPKKFRCGKEPTPRKRSGGRGD